MRTGNALMLEKVAKLIERGLFDEESQELWNKSLADSVTRDESLSPEEQKRILEEWNSIGLVKRFGRSLEGATMHVKKKPSAPEDSSRPTHQIGQVPVNKEREEANRRWEKTKATVSDMVDWFSSLFKVSDQERMWLIANLPPGTRVPEEELRIMSRVREEHPEEWKRFAAHVGPEKISELEKLFDLLETPSS
jgi:hypothetical protein